MSRSVRLSEYYDLFDVVVQPDLTTSLNNNDVLNNDIKNMNITNPFIGFSNWQDFKANNQTETPHGSGTYTTNNIITVEGKKFSPQAINTVSIDEQGNISCYPPNAPVPYWNKVIFRNFDFQFHPHADPNTLAEKYETMINLNYLNTYDDMSDDAHKIYNYDNVPLFLRYPEYRSRSHVIFSACDKTRNPDIEHIFGYNHGATEPIVLNLSMSASNFITGVSNFTAPDGTTYNAGTRYNENLNKECINKLLTKCYFCIEWVYEAKGTNTE